MFAKVCFGLFGICFGAFCLLAVCVLLVVDCGWVVLICCLLLRVFGCFDCLRFGWFVVFIFVLLIVSVFGYCCFAALFGWCLSCG